MSSPCSCNKRQKKCFGIPANFLDRDYKEAVLSAQRMCREQDPPVLVPIPANDVTGEAYHFQQAKQ